MADPLLSSLCTICRTEPPKYVCPGCHTGTCSLPCNQKHKAWANCSGKRDPTVFMPASKLKTPAGVDHDYNFLSSIERERDRNQREVVEEKAMFTRREVREMDNEKRWRKMWFGEEVHFVAAGDRSRGNHHASWGLVSDGEEEEEDNDDEVEGRGHDRRRDGADGKPSHLARKIRHRLELAGTQVVHMPVGMSRQRENTTAWNRRTGGINWCVEWLVYEPDESNGTKEASIKKSTHIRHKALESTPLYKSLGGSIAWQQRDRVKGGDRDDDGNDEEEMISQHARKRRRVLIREVREENRRSAMQAHDQTTWLSTPYPTQNPHTGTWATDRGATASSWLADAEVETRRHCRFYLLKPLTPVGKPKELIPLDGADTLGSALQGRTVLEYPTIYVLPPSLQQDAAAAPCLPEGHVLGSTARRAPPSSQPRKAKAEKRKAAPGKKNNRPDGPAQKRQALGGGKSEQRGGGRGGGRGGRGGRRKLRDAAEEGEIKSDGEVVVDTSSSDPDTSSDEEESLDFIHDPHRHRMDIDTSFADAAAAATTVASTAAIEKAVHFATPQPEKAGLGLVDYGSDTDEDDEDGDVEQEDVDVSKLNPENPELVAGAIREIVGLLS